MLNVSRLKKKKRYVGMEKQKEKKREKQVTATLIE